MSGHVFVSYSHEDKDYVNKLYNWLVNYGFNVWWDERIDPGSQFDKEIEFALDKCGAFIVVMTPNSKQSDWVRKELARALRKKKQVFPLLLQGEEPWLQVETIQWEDVRTGVMPRPVFKDQLSNFATRIDIDSERKMYEEESKKTVPKADTKTNFNLDMWVAILATITIAISTILILFFQGDINSNVFIFSTLLNIYNQGMDRLIPLIILVLLVSVIILYTQRRIQKGGLGKGIYQGILALIESSFLIILISYAPLFLAKVFNNLVGASTIRWAMLCLMIVPAWYFTTHAYSGRRGLYSILILLTTYLLGWLYDRWIGLLFVSIPILLIFYHVIDGLAQVIIPTSNLEDAKERWQKTRAFLAYILGTQSPFWVASNKAVREFDTRITGDLSSSNPGLVWTWPHQVAGLIKNTELLRVEGPGTIFTEPYEIPSALVDLRTQVRTRNINAETKEGIKVPATVFMAFAIDRDRWPKEEWGAEFAQKMINNFEYNVDLDHTIGSYPFASNRIRVTLRKMGIFGEARKTSSKFYWDEWVIKQVEHTARQVLKERSIGELWSSRSDGVEASALDKVTKAMEESLAPKLTEVGVKLFGVRILSYNFDQDSAMAKEKIKIWSTYWEQQVSRLQVETEAICLKEIEKARAYSKSLSLGAFTQAMKIARSISVHLPRYVAAQYCVHVIEQYVGKSELDDTEATQKLQNLKDFLLHSQTEDSE